MKRNRARWRAVVPAALTLTVSILGVGPTRA
jgi:hypothetical protein